jgi:hypothetical protein
MSDALKPYQHEIDAVKEKIIEQKVPTKYPEGLAILSVLACNYSGGDAIAGVFFESACRRDPKFLDDLDKEFGLQPEGGVHWTRMKRIWDAGKKDYQIFRALDIGSIQMNLLESIKDVK